MPGPGDPAGTATSQALSALTMPIAGTLSQQNEIIWQAICNAMFPWWGGGGGGGGLITAVDIDFDALGQQDFTDGDNDLNGLTVHCENVSSTALFRTMGDGTSGLKIETLEPDCYLNGSTRTAPLFTIPAENITPALKPSRLQELWVWCYVDWPETLCDHYAFAGDVVAIESYPCTVPWVRYSAFHITGGISNENVYWLPCLTVNGFDDTMYKPGGSADPEQIADHTPDKVVVLRMRGQSICEVYSGVYMGGFPDRNDLHPRGIIRSGLGTSSSERHAYNGGFTSSHTIGVTLACSHWNTVHEPTRTSNFHHLKIEYMPVQDSGGGGSAATALATTSDPVVVSGEAPPTNGMELIASSASVAGFAFPHSRGFQDATTDTGQLTLTDGFDDYRVSGSEDFIGISTIGRVDGDIIRLTFVEARMLLHGQAVSSGFAQLRLTKSGGSSYLDMGVDADGRCTFQLRTDTTPPVWQLIGGPL